MTLAACLATCLFGLTAGQADPANPEKCPFQEGSPEVDRLVGDLGSKNAETRDKAARRLAELGEKALPKLKAAAYDRDAERAMAARRVLLTIERTRRSEKGDSEERKPPPLLAAVYYDWGRGIFFQMEPSGKVELTMPVKNEQTGKREFRRFRAGSLDELRKEHPEAAREVDLSVKAPSKDTREWWSKTEKWLSLEPEHDEDSGDEGQRDGKTDAEHLEAWRARQRAVLDDFLKNWRDQAPEEDEPTLGALVGTPDPSLRSQLELDDDGGVLVLEVREDSLAERSGLIQYDVITRVAGEAVRDVQDFRRETGRALKAGRFILEVRRAGERKDVKVEPPEKRK